jgi:nitrous oxidase accessory protein NosD
VILGRAFRCSRRTDAGRARLCRPVTLVVVLGALSLSACSSGSGGDSDQAAPSSAGVPSASPSGSPPSTSPPSATPPPPASCTGATTVDVSTAADLRRALADAQPGQVIRLADGRYEGNFVATAKASATAPIHLCGSRGAILDGGDVDGGYTLHLSGATYWQVSGLTVTGGQKGVMVDAGAGNRIEGLMVTSVGDEAIHLRTGSSDNVVSGNSVRDTGLRRPKFGEGIYIGTARSNWCQITNCEPDRSDRNVIEGNDIAGTTAEAVDVKEGTSGGVLRSNTFDGSAMVESDSWVDVKGNGWRIQGNSGRAAPADGFQVHEVLEGWGRGNVFTGNSGTVDAKGFLINVAGPRAVRESTTVGCDNRAGGAGSGLSNVACRNT